MELFAIGICALCAVLFAALVQKTNKEYALLISLGTAAVLLLFLLDSDTYTTSPSERPLMISTYVSLARPVSTLTERNPAGTGPCCSVTVSSFT